MNLPFTEEQFLNVFRDYNVSVWPMQVFLVLTGLAAVFFAVVPRRASGRIITGILSFLWLWIGAVYHLLFFRTINPAAVLFGALFLLQGLLFVYAGLVRKSLGFHFRTDAYGLTGAALLLYAFVVYPTLGYILGHGYPSSPTFGLPCPTTIFTFAILLWAERRVPVYILVIPFLWSLLGFSAAISLGIFEDIGLLVAGVVATGLVIIRNRTVRRAREHAESHKPVEYVG